MRLNTGFSFHWTFYLAAELRLFKHNWIAWLLTPIFDSSNRLRRRSYQDIFQNSNSYFSPHLPASRKNWTFCWTTALMNYKSFKRCTLFAAPMRCLFPAWKNCSRMGSMTSNFGFSTVPTNNFKSMSYLLMHLEPAIIFSSTWQLQSITERKC